MQQSNGHADIAEAIADVKEEARQIAAKASAAVVEKPPPGFAPFEQKAHTLMLESVDRLLDHWVERLNHWRGNTQVLEQQLISQCAKTKDDLTRMNLLGIELMKEVERGEEMCAHLAESLDQIVTEQRL